MSWRDLVEFLFLRSDGFTWIDFLPFSHFIRSGPSLRNHLQAKLGGGISVTCVSDLPSGSGMGTSSILAATALHSLSALLGLPTSQDALVNLVSQVEQILTTGGGWQDQVKSP